MTKGDKSTQGKCLLSESSTKVSGHQNIKFINTTRAVCKIQGGVLHPVILGLNNRLKVELNNC